MSKRKKTISPAATTDVGTAPPAQAETEDPATLGQKIFIVVLYLYVLSLVWLVLSHHWYGVLPAWLDPH
jgi:uncharacterized ion transporter superfamily protein YfcC